MNPKKTHQKKQQKNPRKKTPSLLLTPILSTPADTPTDTPTATPTNTLTDTRFSSPTGTSLISPFCHPFLSTPSLVPLPHHPFIHLPVAHCYTHHLAVLPYFGILIVHISSQLLSVGLLHVYIY